MHYSTSLISFPEYTENIIDRMQPSAQFVSQKVFIAQGTIEKIKTLFDGKITGKDT